VIAPSFASLTTLRVGGTPAAVYECTTAEQLVETVAELDRSGTPLLVVGGGSNLVVADGELDLAAVLVRNDGVTLDDDLRLRVQAGTEWDAVVSYAVDRGLGGIEALSGIPGSAGATPVQNVGAYGSEIADVLTRVRLWNRQTGVDEWVPAEALDLAYRYSNLKFTARAVVLEIELQLHDTDVSIPLRHLGGQRVPLARGAGIRVGRPAGRRAWSWTAQTTTRGPPAPSSPTPWCRPRWPTPSSRRWGRQQCRALPPATARKNSQRRGSSSARVATAAFPVRTAPARLSTKHTLALTNRGGARAADIVDLARRVQAQVREAFGVELRPEPVWVGF